MNRFFLSLALFALLLAPPAGFAAYLSYEGNTIHFGTQAAFAVFSCPSPAACQAGFLNSSVLLTSARPVGDARVEFLVRRAPGGNDSCVLRLDSPSAFSGSPPTAGAPVFASGDFRFSISQTANKADPFRLALNGSSLCILMPNSSETLNFYLVPQTNGSLAGAAPPSNASATAQGSIVSSPPSAPASAPALETNLSAPSEPRSAPKPSAPGGPAASEGPAAPLAMPILQPASPSALRADAAPKGPSGPLAPFFSGGLFSSAPLSFSPSAPYPVLSGLYLLILLLSARYVHARPFYLGITLLPLLVGLLLLPPDGFKPAGLAAWVLLWLALYAYHRHAHRRRPSLKKQKQDKSTEGITPHEDKSA
ncbi:Uncharacterised protein [uncultured archaeon]|nr:Uncharacterised protein [uncultured archaeon]